MQSVKHKESKGQDADICQGGILTKKSIKRKKRTICTANS